MHVPGVPPFVSNSGHQPDDEHCSIESEGNAQDAALGEPGFAWTLDNYGRIVGHGPGGLGVELASGGTQSEIPG